MRWFLYQINLPIFVQLSLSKLWMNNSNFVQRTLTLCTNNVNYVQTSFLCNEQQLCATNINLVRWTSTLCNKWQLCAANVNFVQRTTTLCSERQLCGNNVHKRTNSACLTTCSYACGHSLHKVVIHCTKLAFVVQSWHCLYKVRTLFAQSWNCSFKVLHWKKE